MSCYFRHMKEVLAEAGIRVTKENKKYVDRIIHGLVDIEYKECSPTWRAVKKEIQGDDKARARFVSALEKALKKAKL